MAATIANVEMAAAWDGAEGEDWARDWERYDSGVATYHRTLLEAAAPAEDAHVLDVGCGNGQVTRDLARLAPRGAALGIDLSSQMLARAAELARAEGLNNASYVLGDAQVHPFQAQSYDLVVSRFGAMFFADPTEAFRNLARSMRAGGRLVLLSWQSLEANGWLQAIRGSLALGRELPAPPVGAPGPFGLADPDQVGRWLSLAGFEGVEIRGREAAMRLGADADDALGFVASTGVARGLLEGSSPNDRAQALALLRERLVAGQTATGVFLPSAAWMTTAVRP
jgi:SAM-dependent methyltransferase